MPHARIVAESLERARLVARQLQTRGYTVEIVSPGAPPESPADLEITVTADSALPFTDEVYAAPGSILGLTEYEPENKPAPEYYLVDEQPPSAGTSVREALAETRKAFADGWQNIAGPLSRRFARYRTVRAERREAQRREQEHRRAEAVRAREEQAARMARVALEQERARAQQAEAARIAAEKQREQAQVRQAEAARLARISAEKEREQARTQQAEAARLARIAAEQENARHQSEAAEARRLAEIAAEKERARLRAIELERQRVARRAAEEEEARRLAEQEKLLVARRAEERRQREELKADALRRRYQTQHRPAPPTAAPPSDRRWKAAVAGAASVSALAVLALFSTDRKPAAPVSNQTVVGSQSVEQEVPFGAATAVSAEAALKKVAAPAPSVNDAPKPRPKPRAVFRVDSDSGLDEEEPEVIVRRRGRRPPHTGEQASRVNRITDEDAELEEEDLE
jgi:hypothetical protein